MRLASFDGGFGRVEEDLVVPMGEDLADRMLAEAPWLPQFAPVPA